MRIKYVDQLPKCNFCGKNAKYDAPTKMISWAYMCGDCAKEYAGALALGTEFKIKTHLKINEEQATIRAEQANIRAEQDARYAPHTSEDEVQCPHCGHRRLVEADSEGQWFCESCGTHCYNKMLMDDITEYLL